LGEFGGKGGGENERREEEGKRTGKEYALV